jgi:hypothetical protein
MTRRQLRRVIFFVMGIYLLAIGIGVVLRIVGPTKDNMYYETFKDMIPFVFAIPAAYLGYAFQKRGSFLQSLRSLWSGLVKAVNDAIQYTYYDESSQEDFGKVLTSLSIVIDEVRGVYRNIGERLGDIGLYPYEPIKDIHKVVSELGFGKIDENKRMTHRRKIIGHWKSIRRNFLAEFDRVEPTKVVSPYVEEIL